MAYAVIDTNVIVASLLSRYSDSATVRVMDAVYSGKDIGESNLVTGNLKHYPSVEFVVTPAQFCEMYNL